MRSVLFVCYGNTSQPNGGSNAETSVAEQVKRRCPSAGLHALAGRKAHPLALKLLARDLVFPGQSSGADCSTPEMVASRILSCHGFWNLAETMPVYPDAKNKIHVAQRLCEGKQRNREVADRTTATRKPTRNAMHVDAMRQKSGAERFPCSRNARQLVLRQCIIE